MNNVEIIAESIKNDQLKIEEFRMQIKDLYQKINDGLSASNSVVTKGIENLYKEIDSTFDKKSKLEQNILVLKRKILIELGVV